MAIDIMGIKPHQVSRDLRGTAMFFYGEPKSGKTTNATKFPKHLLLAFEKGYNAIPGANAQPINTWGEFIQVLSQLKKAEAKEAYETIIIDTADIAYKLCEKYILSKQPNPKTGGQGVESVSDIPYGKGYQLIADEFDERLRSIMAMDYGVVIISHSADKTFKDENENEFQKIVPTLDKRARLIVSRMADVIGYSKSVDKEDGTTGTILFMRGTPRIEAGSRYRYTPDHIEFSYNNLVNCIADAIEKECAEGDASHFTDKATTAHSATIDLDFDEILASCQASINALMKDKEESALASIGRKITVITDKYLGMGNKISACSAMQVDALNLVDIELKELLAQGV